MDIYFALGAIGLFLLLAAYALTMSKKITQDSLHYHSLNFVGCVLLVAYAIKIDSLVFVVLESAWGLIALGFIIKNLKG